MGSVGLVAALGPLESLRKTPVVGFLFEGTPLAVALKIGGVLAGLAVLIAVARAVAGALRRGGAKDAKALVREGRYEEAGDLHTRSGSLQAAVHMYERAGAFGKAARAAAKLGQGAVAARFFERAGELDAAAETYRQSGDHESAARAVRTSQAPPAPGPSSSSSHPADQPGARAAPRPSRGSFPAGLQETTILPAGSGGEPEPPPTQPFLAVPAPRSSVERAPAAAARYETERELGRGAMAIVYRARDKILGRAVALKFLNATAADEASVKLFLREAQVAAGLSHPGIVTIYDVGVAGDRPFISMELIEGENVFRLLETRGALPASEAVWIALRTAEALDYAHARHVVHRDIKPSNLMVTVDGVLKVTDFGLARAFDTVARATVVSGTPAYMAPEQFTGVVTDGRADIFSLGASLYEMLTLALPFPGMDRNTAPRPPSQLRPELPPALDAVVLQTLAPRPEDRFQTAAEFARALEAACAESDATEWRTGD